VGEGGEGGDEREIHSMCWYLKGHVFVRVHESRLFDYL